jgi:uncharacterized protein YfeS
VCDIPLHCPKIPICCGQLTPKLTNAAREALKKRAGLDAIAEWERQNGAFTKEEMEQARRNVLLQMKARPGSKRST